MSQVLVFKMPFAKRADLAFLMESFAEDLKQMVDDGNDIAYGTIEIVPEISGVVVSLLDGDLFQRFTGVPHSGERGGDARA